MIITYSNNKNNADTLRSPIDKRNDVKKVGCGQMNVVTHNYPNTGIFTTY